MRHITGFLADCHACSAAKKCRCLRTHLVKWLHLLIALILLAFIPAAHSNPSAVAARNPSANPPTELTIALDDNYPPYTFLNANGTLSGYLVDSWKLWETKTGIRIKLEASDWSIAQQRMREGRADVLDTAFKTPERLLSLDFSKPYAEIPVAIYSHAGIGGIADLTTLRGFLIGVKEADACISALKNAGIHTLQTYPSYETLIKAAIKGEVRVFCLDEPPANYLLYRYHAEHDFRQAFRLSSGQFHRAVHKGNQATLDILEKGFAAFSASELQALNDKWKGTALVTPYRTRFLGYALLLALFAGGLLALWVITLRRMVRQRTADLSATMQAIPDLMFEVDIHGRYHRCHAHREDLLLDNGDSLIGKTFSEIMPPQAAETCQQAISEANDNGQSSGHQIELTVPAGKRWFELSAARKTLASNTDPHFIVISRDITQRRLAEAMLRQQSEQLRIISYAAQEINAKLDPPVIMRKLINAARQITGAESGAAGLMHDDLMIFSEYCLNGQQIAIDYRFAPGFGVPGHVMQTLSPYLCNDAENDPYVVPDIRTALGFHNLLNIPVLNRRGKLLACFEIHNKHSGFDETDIQLLMGLAASAAIAFENTAILTEQKRTENALRESELLKSSVLANAVHAIIATDTKGLITVFNHGAEQLLTYTAEEIIGKKTPELFHDRDEMNAYAKTLSTRFGFDITPGFEALISSALHDKKQDEQEWTFVRKDGSRVPVRLAVTAMHNDSGDISGYLGIATDISEHREAEAAIKQLAYFDPLTGLPNRAQLTDRINYTLGRARRNQEEFALIFLDLDRFKNVNDSLGHQVGDELLIQLAQRLRSALRDEDTISRLGGDEFILLLPGTDTDGAARVASKLLDITAPPYCIGIHELTCTSSIGIAIYPNDGETFEALSMSADSAMYRAKKAGRNAFRFFTNEMQVNSARALKLENALRRALDNNEMHLHYQPQFSLPDQRIIGAEALLRWTNNEMGEISPAEFIPIAEDSALILPIGEWVLRSAARQMSHWIDSGLSPMPVSVNLSVVQFRQAKLIQQVTQILEEEKLPARHLVLELTESVAMDNPLAAIAVMRKLREHGIRMAIDDFGTGYSSMNYLKRFQAHKLKIDKSFIQDSSTNPDDQAIIEAIINLAHSLSLRSLAEGVETREQLDFLCNKGCKEAQGFYFSRALPPDEFLAFALQRSG